MTEPGDPSQRTAIFRRSATRGIAGVLALGLVAVLEIARRHADPELPRQGGPPSAAPPTAVTVPVAPTLSPVPTRAPRRARLQASSAPTPAQLEIDLQHGFKSGTLTVSVDGEQVLEEELHSRVVGKVLTIERRRGRFTQTVEVPPGSHRVRVVVRWNGSARARTVNATFQDGETRRLGARLQGLTKNLVLYWR